MVSVQEVTSETWEKEVLQSSILTVVDFWHESCLWCKKLEPIFREVAEEYRTKAKFISFNVLASSDSQQIAVEYGILGVPTIGFFCEKKPVNIVVGFKQKEELKKLIDDIIAKHKECLKSSTELKIN